MKHERRSVLKRAVQAAVVTATPIAAMEVAIAQGASVAFDLMDGGKLQIKPGAKPGLPPELILVRGSTTKPATDGVFELKSGGKLILEKEKITSFDPKAASIPKEFSLHVKYKNASQTPDALAEMFTQPGAMTLSAPDAQLRFLNVEKLPKGTVESLATKMK